MENVFVTRHPVFRRDLDLHAYALWFRSGARNTVELSDGDTATSEVIMNTFTVFDLGDLVGDSPVFLNLSRRYLLEPAPLPLPTENAVIQVLEDIRIDADILAAITRLRYDGYAVAIGDHHLSHADGSLLDSVDMITLGMPFLLSRDAAHLIERLRRFNVKLLASGIEDDSQLRRCATLGCDFFQGSFLSKPDMGVEGGRSAKGKAILDLLADIHNPGAELGDLERVTRQHPLLQTGLLRYINSNYYCNPVETTALRQAVMMMGVNELRRWASMASLRHLPDGKPHELANILFVRARMAELLSIDMAPEYSEACFLVGLFSGLDAVLDMPMETVLDRVGLHGPTRDALLYRAGPVGQVLSAVLAYEEADPSGLHLPNLTAEQVRQHYLTALQWQQQQDKLL